MRKEEDWSAQPLPRNVARQRYAGLKAAWHVSVLLDETGAQRAHVGKLDLLSRWMRFEDLSAGLWEGPVEEAAAEALLRAASEVQVDVWGQYRLF